MSELSLLLCYFVFAAGKLVNNKIDWRGDSGLEDGREEMLDLSKGMYDAGDHMKFGFPMAFTATVLSWAILEYGDHMKAVKQLGNAQASLKWITDYLINAHPSPNLLYVQVVANFLLSILRAKQWKCSLNCCVLCIIKGRWSRIGPRMLGKAWSHDGEKAGHTGEHIISRNRGCSRDSSSYGIGISSFQENQLQLFKFAP